MPTPRTPTEHIRKNEDGSYKKRSLTDKEKAEKAEKIAQIEKKLSDGADFSGLYEEYSENTDYPGGYYFSLTSAGDYIADIVTKAFSLEEGEWIKYTSDTYGTFFIKRAALDDGRIPQKRMRISLTISTLPSRTTFTIR